jgi:uncharacterized glyoxalase superfamily protein PhnB
MTDPMDALYLDAPAIDPDPAFAARLRARLQQLLLDHPGGSPMSTTTTTTTTTGPTGSETAHDDVAWGPTLTPYIAVADARRAIDWYVAVFDGHRRGDAYVMDDGRIGHAEIGIGDAVLMISDPFSDYGVEAPSGPAHSHSIHVQVPDVDRTVRTAAAQGATIEREPSDEPYGRVASMVDPFGHRWLLNQPPTTATRLRQGDVAYITLNVPDDEQAKAFYGAVLGWQFSAGRVDRGWNVDGVNPPTGLAGGAGGPGADLCYRVTDIEAARARVADHGGSADPAESQPYGLLARCTDNQGATFYLWQPA